MESQLASEINDQITIQSEKKKYRMYYFQEQIKYQMQQAVHKYGSLDVCYLVDSTSSMRPYIKQTRDSIRQSCFLIKQLTQREINWSTICYYDIEQKPLNGFYLQHDFTTNMEDIEKFLDEVETKGGSDPPEDVKGAIQQMFTNLKWSSRFKIALLITDAPCHGKKYHNTRDLHPNDDIEETILQLIDQNIVLIGLNFLKNTTQMYEEINKIFVAKEKSGLFSLIDLNQITENNISECLINGLLKVSLESTGTNSIEKKVKNPTKIRKCYKNIQLYDLCTQGIVYNLQSKVQCLQKSFNILRVNLKEQISMIQVQNIGKKMQDFDIVNEGTFDCLITEPIFASGFQKNVYLMKKAGASKEMFVAKTSMNGPYQSLMEILTVSTSHLVSKKLMERFMIEIEEAQQGKQKKIKVPKLCFTDLLILKEEETKYFIGEVFLLGDFIKYNNNYGYVNENFTQQNMLAQAFSFYTFFNSGTEYLVCDIQGVGNSLTDPAINTKTGDFDETDMGNDGIGMFLSNFKRFTSHEYIQEILNLLEMNIFK